MSNKVDMNVFLHSLLVINKMNNFTVTEAKNALLAEHPEFIDSEVARKFVYRQLTHNIKKGLIKRTDYFSNGKKKVIYSKTSKLLASTVTPIERGSPPKKVTVHQPLKQVEIEGYKAELKKELVAYETNLSASVEEAKEYKRLSTRFPEMMETLQQYQLQTKKKSAIILGKIHALQNLLGYSTTKYQQY